MTTTPLDRPVILAVLSSKTTQCTGDSCSTPIAIGDRAAFDCTRGPGILCWTCAEATGGRITRTPDEPATPAADADTASDEPCACPTTAGGFTDTGDGRYVHATCGRPTRQALDAERARTATDDDAGHGDVSAQQVRTVRLGGDGDGRAQLGDVGTLTKTAAPALPATVPTPNDGPDVDESAGDDAQEVDELTPTNDATPTPEERVAGPVAPRVEHDEPIGPNPCRCGDGTIAGAHHDDQPCAHTSEAGDQPRPLADLAPWTADGIAYGTDPNMVAAELIEAVRLGILAGDLRGRQKEIGPSEVGHPCPRALAYRLAGTPHTGTEVTPWRQRVGTLVHADNDDHLAADNERRGVRWLTNLRVRVGELYPGRPIDGTLDVFDVQTGTVIDEKVPGSTAMRTYGPGKPEAPQYRTQLQLYGAGCLAAGYRPAWVGTVRISPARELADYVFKVEPFDEQHAVDALSRAGGIARMVDQLGQGAPALLPGIEHNCHRCPWLRRGSTDLATGCPGVDTPKPTRRASVDDLVG